MHRKCTLDKLLHQKDSEMKINITRALVAGYREDGARVNILPGIYEAEITNHLFPNTTSDEMAIQVNSALRDKPLLIRCSEYDNEIDWADKPNGANGAEIFI
jgi:cytosine/adenosine deaminase-related metal-dependent hydrolase